jgi:RNA polymerase-associated protein CTR9
MDFSQRPPTSSTSDFSDHSFHSRSKSSANVNSPKRLSMFSSRSRSNTTNVSSAPTRQLPAESLTYGEHSVSPAPHEEKSSENVARSLLVRGSRILRRQGSKLNVVATTLEEEDEFGKSAARFEVSKVFQRVPKLKKNESSKIPSSTALMFQADQHR